VAKKWMQSVARGIEKRGTSGSLRKEAGVSGEEKLSAADIRRMAAKARRMKGKDGKLTEEGRALMRKVIFAANAAGVELPKAK
jgi:hypothetical protein